MPLHYILFLLIAAPISMWAGHRFFVSRIRPWLEER